MRAVAVVFGQAGDRYVQVQRVFDNLPYHFHLPFAAIGDDEVGQGKFLVNGTAVAAENHFLHRSVVVGADNSADVVFSVFLFGRFELFEHYARCNCVAAADVGVVEKLYAERGLGEFELVLYLFHQPHALLLGVELFCLFEPVEFVFLNVELRQSEQLVLVAALGDGECDVFEREIEAERYDYLAGLASVTVAHFGNAEREQFFVAFA